MLGGDVAPAWNLLGKQCEWYLDFLEAHSACDELARQFLHFFANMSSVRVA